MDKITLFGTIKDIISQLCKLEDNKLYIVDIREKKSNRSLEQNKLLWKLIHRIAEEQYQSDNEVYCALLERADALSTYIMTECEMEEALRKSFRGVQFVRYQEVNNKDRFIYKVYIGSSKMNTKEMTKLIDTAIQLCSELGIPTIDYEC